MALFHSLPMTALRPSQACHNCLRMFTSSARAQAGPESTPFTELLNTMNATQKENPRPRTPSPLRPRPQLVQTNRSERTSSLYNVLGKTVQDIAVASRRKESLADIQRAADRQDLERQMTRRWKAGDVYAPHDLSGVEMSKWRQSQPKGRPKKDVFDMLKINPLDHYKNFAMMSEYVTETGRIKHSRDTGLRPVNQRKLAKALRRAIGLGLMPSVHRHPEILDLERKRQGRGF